MALFLFIFVCGYDPVVFLPMLNIPVCLLHETEEYIFPSGFAKFFNLHIFKSGRTDAPLDVNFIFCVNILLIRIFLFPGGFLSVPDYFFGPWIPCFSFFAGAAHIVLGIAGQQKYNPGLIVSPLLNIPYGGYVIYYPYANGLVSHPVLNPFFAIGLGLNLMLPVPGANLKKRYNAKNK